MAKRTERKDSKKKKIFCKDTKSDWVREKPELRGNYWDMVRILVTGYKQTAELKGGRSCSRMKFSAT